MIQHVIRVPKQSDSPCCRSTRNIFCIASVAAGATIVARRIAATESIITARHTLTAARFAASTVSPHPHQKFGTECNSVYRIRFGRRSTEFGTDSVYRRPNSVRIRYRFGDRISCGDGIRTEFAPDSQSVDRIAILYRIRYRKPRVGVGPN